MTRAVQSRRVVTPDGVRPATILIDDGIISSVAPYDTRTDSLTDHGDAVLGPALVDTHVHLNEPGRTDWEGFSSGTQAAAAGGVGTIIDMPLNSVPPTTSVQALEEKREAARGQCAVDVGFLAGVVPGNARELRRLHHAGALGFKAFMCDSGVSEFPPVASADLRQALLVLASLDALLMVHAEDPAELRAPTVAAARRHDDWLATRPAAAETRAVEQLIQLSREFGARIHVVHVSSPDSARMIAEARDKGVGISGETCPHYLTFTTDEVPDGATEYKCAPPLRDTASRDGLWDALRRGWLDVVVTDHSPAPPNLKLREAGDFLVAWGGIASLQLRLPAVWTGARERGFGVEDVTRWIAESPARLVGLEDRKGRLVPGSDADLVVWHPEREFIVEESALRHRHKLTPWLGRRLAGVVEATYLRGEPVFRRGEPDPPMRGQTI
jgi:allantoinase